MIGGRVLDLSALLAFASQTSIYASALVWTAVEEDIVLLVPATAGSLAWSAVSAEAEPVLEVLFGLPVVVLDDLNAARSRDLGRLLRTDNVRIDLAHAALCARQRGWPLVTAEPGAYGELSGTLTLEPLP